MFMSFFKAYCELVLNAVADFKVKEVSVVTNLGRSVSDYCLKSDAELEILRSYYSWPSFLMFSL